MCLIVLRDCIYHGALAVRVLKGVIECFLITVAKGCLEYGFESIVVLFGCTRSKLMESAVVGLEQVR